MSQDTREIASIECAGETLLYYLPDSKDHIQNILRTGKRLYEEDMLLDILGRDLPPGVVIDVGANIGNHTVFFGKVLKRRVIALEPYQKAFSALRKNVELNELSTALTLLQKAAGPAHGRAEIEPPPEANWGQCRISSMGTGPIEVIPLDDLSISEPVALVKIDVEGMELAVLEGAQRLLKRDQPILYIEAQDAARYAIIRRWLRRFDYQMVRRFSHTPTYGFVPCRNPQEQMALLLEKADALAGLNELLKAQQTVARELSRAEPTLRRAAATILEKAFADAAKSLDKKTAVAAKQAAQEVLSEIVPAQERLYEQQAALYTKTDVLEAAVREAKHELRQEFADALCQATGRIVTSMQSMIRELRGNLTAVSARVEPAVQRVVGDEAHTVRLKLPFNHADVFIRLPRQLTGCEAAGGPPAATSCARDSRGSSNEQTVAGDAIRIDQTPDSGRDDKVSVIVTTYNCQGFVRDSILNLLEQTHRDLEVVIVDDASDDRTFEVLLELAAQDARIRPFKMFHNRGTYWCKNFGITRSTGDYVTFQDSDDKSDADRLRLQLDELRRHNAVMCTCNYVRVDAAGAVVLNRGKRERKAIMAPLLDKEAMLRRVGYFDSVRTSADDEFNRRVAVALGHERTCHVDRALYFAAVREGSLTTSARTQAGITAPTASDTDQSFLSAPRREYVRQYTCWHEALKAGSTDPRIRFPLLRRRFPAPALLMAEEHHDSYVTASMASIPARQAMLEQTVGSMLPQVDVLNVYLNGYEATPRFLLRSGIHVVHSREYGDRRDNGKFFFLDSLLPGYHFTIDDDIVYPPDYVQQLVLKIEQYDRRAIVGCHGVNLANPVVNYMQGREVLHFKRALGHDRLVNLLGTGTVAYHISTIEVSTDDFKEPGMADLWLAVAAKHQRVPMIAVERPPRWLIPLDEADQNSLYSAAVSDCRRQTKVAQAEEPWSLAELCAGYPLIDDLLRRFSVPEIRYGGLEMPDLLPALTSETANCALPG